MTPRISIVSRRWQRGGSSSINRCTTGRNGSVWGPERPQTPNFRVPWYVTLFGYICAVIGLLIFFLPVASRTAYAFTVDGEWYPDSLAGYEVTLNTQLTEPPSSLVGQYWLVLAETPDSPASMPSGSVGTFRYLYFETQQYAGNSHPWYIAALFNESTSDTTLPNIPFVQYWARWGFDGYSSVKAYWGLKSGVTRPTIDFGSPNDISLYPIMTNHDFIIWLVENSDFRSRYSAGSWVDPVVAQVGPSFSWVIDENNVPCVLVVVRSNLGVNGTYSTVWTSSDPCPLTGSYTAQYSGYYKFIFYYDLSTGSGPASHQYTWGPSVEVVLDAPGSQMVFSDVETSTNLYEDLIVWCHVSGDPVSVALQYEGSNGSWVTQGQLRYMKRDDSYGYGWMYQAHVPDNQNWRLLATDAEGNSVSYLLGGHDTNDYEVAAYIQQLVVWVGAFVAIFPDMFLWMPIEVRVVLVSAIIVMIILGLVGWLKS